MVSSKGESSKSAQRRLKKSGKEREAAAKRRYREAILDAVADLQHKGPDRETVVKALLESRFPKVKDADEPNTADYQAAKTAIAKTLGRLVHDGHVRESLAVSSRSPKVVGLANRGYVGINVDIVSLREARIRDAPNEVRSQEELMERLANDTASWRGTGAVAEAPARATDSNARGTSEANRLRRSIVLLDTAIVHSAELDILISVLYRREEDFMAYVREVVQAAPHVKGTRTMFVSHRSE